MPIFSWYINSIYILLDFKKIEYKQENIFTQSTHVSFQIMGYMVWTSQGMALFSIEGKETIQKEIQRITEDYTSFYGENEQYEMLRS